MRALLTIGVILLCTGTACTKNDLMPGVPTPEERRPLAIRRAAQELGCAEQELKSHYLGSRLFNVSGCGRKATYRVICKFSVGSCYLIGGPDDQLQGVDSAQKPRRQFVASAMRTGSSGSLPKR